MESNRRSSICTKKAGMQKISVKRQKVDKEHEKSGAGVWGRKPIRQSIYTSTSSSSQRTSQRSCDSRKMYNSDINMAGGDCSAIPRIGPFKGLKVDSPLDALPSKYSQEVMMSRYRFKERSKIFHQPVLPSNLKLKTPICKVLEDGQHSGTKG
ncbi:hypothetical protein J6590_082422 [Homalodisca vitripennis]|nr:hypothetical protein J6590_082422 [Homalodisca vitripennis]